MRYEVEALVPPNEKVLWQGVSFVRPVTSAITWISLALWLAVLSSVFVTGYMFFEQLTAHLLQELEGILPLTPVEFGIFFNMIVTFAIIAIIAYALTHIYKSVNQIYAKSRSQYLLTNRRVIIKSHGFKNVIEMVELLIMGRITIEKKQFGYGSVTFHFDGKKIQFENVDDIAYLEGILKKNYPKLIR